MPPRNLKNTTLDRLKPEAKRYEIKDTSRLDRSRRAFWDDHLLFPLSVARQAALAEAWGIRSTPHDPWLRLEKPMPRLSLRFSDARRGDAVDPAAQRDVKKAGAKLGDTVSEFARLYLELYAKKKKRTWQTDQRILDVDVIPYIGSFKLTDLSRANVQAVLDRIDRRGAQNQAWQTLKVVRKMLNYAVSRGALAVNPAAGIEREATYTAKQRALSDKELEGLFQALPNIKMQGPLRDLLQFQLLTAVRPSEARMAQWTEIDLETLRWIIPGERMKNGQPHLVPLTSPVVEILKRMQGLGDYVFPGERPDLLSTSRHWAMLYEGPRTRRSCRSARSASSRHTTSAELPRRSCDG